MEKNNKKHRGGTVSSKVECSLDMREVVGALPTRSTIKALKYLQTSNFISKILFNTIFF